MPTQKLSDKLLKGLKPPKAGQVDVWDELTPWPRNQSWGQAEIVFRRCEYQWEISAHHSEAAISRSEFCGCQDAGAGDYC